LKQAEQIATPSQKTQSSEVDEMTMQSIKASVLKFINDEDGLTVVEYAVAGGLISAAVVVAFTALGGTVNGVIVALDTALGG
jgi:pilus assembly protein Flp/PilA